MEHTSAQSNIVTRFAPSPTGYLTLGNYRTALFSYLFAKQHKGKCILRIEDTDKERSKPEYEQDIYKSAAWLGISFDETYKQSERTKEHEEYLQKLIDTGHAYISKETEVKEGGRSEVIRFKNPNKKVTFTDLIRGDITFDTTDLKDFVIAKSMTEPLFHLAVVVDDADMGITHIVRGDDHISNTPRQILIQEALGFQIPTYAHLPLMLAPDRSKLSKRNGAISIKEIREKGYLPEAVINLLALLGWNPGTDKEIYSLDELLKDFDISRTQKGGAIFNEEKLNWFNKEYLKMLPEDKKQEIIRKFVDTSIIDEYALKRASEVIFERIETTEDMSKAFKSGEFSYLNKEIEYATEMLLWKKEPSYEKTSERLSAVAILLMEMPEEPTRDEVKNIVWDFAEQEGRGEVLWPLRVALSGKDKSPDPFMLLEILGKNVSLKRIQAAILKLHA